MYSDEELQEFFQKRMYCAICGKQLNDFDELKIKNPLDLDNVVMIHKECYDNSHFLRKD